MDLRERCSDEGSRIELTQDRVQRRTLVLEVLNLRVLLPELISRINLKEIVSYDSCVSTTDQSRSLILYIYANIYCTNEVCKRH
jgi:hypothetical protein